MKESFFKSIVIIMLVWLVFSPFLREKEIAELAKKVSTLEYDLGICNGTLIPLQGI